MPTVISKGVVCVEALSIFDKDIRLTEGLSGL